MLVRFWGVRGSIPVPEKEKLQVGGNTSCVEVEVHDKLRLILDMGTGIRLLGKKIVQEIKAGIEKENIILLSHTHWDHLQGFPFFDPIFMPNVHILLYGPSKANRKLERVLSGQMEYDYWPVKFSQLPSHLDFNELSEGVSELRPGVTVQAARHIHPGVAFGYRITYQGKSIVYSTDTEHFKNQMDQRVIDLAQDCDLLIHDAQYTDEELDFKLGWGHSSWMQAIKVAKEAHVKRLALFHQDPTRTDEQAFEIEKQAKAMLPQAFLAREGLTVDLDRM